ncbi:MAG: threonylcarbamoyl-AMP synthase [Pedosphaera sp.]|nr:threonylcarbamoyl-AMP synthase [Pedosphaera sp.]
MKDRITARVLQTHSPALFQEAVEEAARILRAGDLVAVPTETVYGLAANALDPSAVSRIFTVKGRPAHNPLIVHVSDVQMARRCVSSWPALADRLAAAFWPGPLTLVLPRSPLIPDVVTAGGSTVGVRLPSHPFIRTLIQACGFPLAAPSANRSNELSPTNAIHVERSLGLAIPLIVDGGQSQVGIESTVLDLTLETPRVLRPGMIHEESLVAVVGNLASGAADPESPLKSPGLLLKHYAPKARLMVCRWSSEAELEALLLKIWPTSPRGVSIIAHSQVPLSGRFDQVAVIPNDPDAFARAIYSELHRCDDAGAELIVVEDVPQTPPWRAIRDRLARASG